MWNWAIYKRDPHTGGLWWATIQGNLYPRPSTQAHVCPRAGVLAGLFWLQKGKSNTIAGAQQAIGLLFFELLFLGFRALFVALFTFPTEYKMVPSHAPH